MDYTIKPTHNIVITGGGGYVGAKLAEKLASLGCNIYLVDINFNILAKTLDVNFSNVYLKILDLTDRKSVKEVVRDCNPQHIFHFASVIDRSRDFSIFERLYKVNVTGTFNLLEELLDVPYVNFCFASTSEVYGDWKGLPFKEEDCLNPMSPYSLTKLYSENLIKLHSKINQDKPYKILRIFNFFGIDMPETTFMGQMVKSYKDNNIFAMTKGEQARDLLHIEDLLEQILFITQSNVAQDTLNVCSGKSYKLIDLVENFKVIVNSNFNYTTNLEYRDNEVWETLGDNAKISSLGYKLPNYSIDSLLIDCRNL